MEDIINTNTWSRDTYFETLLSIDIDNTTDFKDFVIQEKVTSIINTVVKNLVLIKLDVSDSQNPILDINGIELTTKDIQLLKDFLNQI